MLTEECRLNDFLEKKGVEIVDTDLGERIVQLAHQPPSHIVLPAIHLKKAEISKLFNHYFKTDPASEDPEYLTGVARNSLRQYLIKARAAISGVNFGIADSGGVVVCTNEGNADMGIHHADLYIAAMGVEKLIPGKDQLPVFLKLLARSATGQAITAYTSHLMKPPPDKAYHIILVDNGRTDILARKEYREVLKCIRCGACINTCPVYRRSGGYSYGYSIQGPIGSVLAPLKQMEKYFTLPYASSLCGSCTDVCPVKINLHELLFRLRTDAITTPGFPRSKKWMLWILDGMLFHSILYRWAGHVARLLMKYLPRGLIYNRFNIWGNTRELPDLPDMSFREWYKKGQHDD
jgi:L-lactate dehydrogenase complex protein LldF